MMNVQKLGDAGRCHRWLWAKELYFVCDKLAVLPLEWPAVCTDWLLEDDCQSHTTTAALSFSNPSTSARSRQTTTSRCAHHECSWCQPSSVVAPPPSVSAGRIDDEQHMDAIRRRVVLGMSSQPRQARYRRGCTRKFSPAPLRFAAYVESADGGHVSLETIAFGEVPNCRGGVCCVKARACPQPDVIASKDVGGMVHIWNTGTAFGSESQDEGGSASSSKAVAAVSSSSSSSSSQVNDYSPFSVQPVEQLGGHTAEGLALVWNPSTLQSGLLASAGEDRKILVWDTDAGGKSNTLSYRSTLDRSATSGVQPVISIDKADEVCVNGLEWMAGFTKDVLVSVGHEGAIKLWDIRACCDSQPQSVQHVSTSPLLSLSFCGGSSSVSTPLFLTGGYDSGSVSLWDMRRFGPTAIPVKKLDGHAGPVTRLRSHPSHLSLFLSASLDHRVGVWDISRDEKSHHDDCVGKEESRKATGSSCWDTMTPELLSMYGGHHNAVVNDVQWATAATDSNKEAQQLRNNRSPTTESLMAASVDSNNLLQVWTVAEGAVCSEEDCAASLSDD